MLLEVVHHLQYLGAGGGEGDQEPRPLRVPQPGAGRGGDGEVEGAGPGRGQLVDSVHPGAGGRGHQHVHTLWGHRVLHNIL